MKTKFGNTQYHGTNFACQCDMELGCGKCHGLRENLLLQLPHGSGINNRWFIKFLTDKVICSNTFDIMGENGMYRQYVPFSIVIPDDPDEKWFGNVTHATGISENPIDFNLVFHTKNRYWINRTALRDYLEETVRLSLDGK